MCWNDQFFSCGNIKLAKRESLRYENSQIDYFTDKLKTKKLYETDNHIFRGPPRSVVIKKSY